VHHGPLMACMHGYEALQKTTPNAIYTMSPNQEDTESQDQLTCSLNTAWPRHIRQYPMSLISQKNSRPTSQRLIGQQELNRS
jgi:hypothetical protein